MASAIQGGPRKWGGERADDGHRTFTVTWLVRTALTDGPATVMTTSGLYNVGAAWSVDNDSDSLAYCTPYMKVRALHTDEPNRFWEVDQKFTTRPSDRCQDDTIENPLLEPMTVKGSFVRYLKEVSKDRNGDEIKTSSHEMIRGPQVEFDHGNMTVEVGQNVPALQLGLLAQYHNKVNDRTLWGLSARKVKLSDISWERKYFGTCAIYYHRQLTFEVNFETFDRDVFDEGTKVLNGEWGTNRVGTDTGWVLLPFEKTLPQSATNPNPNNPQHFIQYTDKNSNPARVILDGAGQPYDGSGTGEFPSHHVEYYGEENLLLLGIPTIL